jgi:hypothetical protein
MTVVVAVHTEVATRSTVSSSHLKDMMRSP